MPFDIPIDRSSSCSVKWSRYDATDILPMWLADMDFQVAQPIQDALKKRIEHDIYGYSSPPKELNKAVCDHMAEDYDWEIDEDWIVWLPGVLPGLIASCKATRDFGEWVIVQSPVFSEFFKVVKHAERELCDVPMVSSDGRWSFDLEQLERKIQPETQAVLLCLPNNPTGTIFTEQELLALVKLCAQHDVAIISDEIHSGLVLDAEKQHRPLAKIASWYRDKIITLTSPSKTFNLGGVNCAYAVIPSNDLRKKFIAECRTLGVMPMASAFGYAATLAAYRDSKSWKAAVIDYLRGNYEYLQSSLERVPGIELHSLDATYLAWLDVTQLGLRDSRQFFEQIGVGVSPGDEFGDENFVRLNFACARSRLKLAVKRIESGVLAHNKISNRVDHSLVINRLCRSRA